MNKQQEILEVLRESNLGTRFAASADGKAVGAWSEGLGRFVMVVSEAITGEWVIMPYELLVNGELPYKPEDWKE